MEKDKMRHYAEARILPDRTELLHRMPKGSVTCEAGVAFGRFSRQILQICQPARHIMIDSWVHAGRYDEQAFAVVRQEFAAELAAGSVEIIRAGSVKGLCSLADACLDFLYIDTDHSYDTTRRELRAAAKKVRPGGIIAGHDYKAQGRYDLVKKKLVPYGVVEAVQEFMAAADYDLLYLTNEVDGHLSFALSKHPG